MPDDNVVKRILQFKATGIRKHRRPRLRWTDSVESDFMTINEKTRTKAQNAYVGCQEVWLILYLRRTTNQQEEGLLVTNITTLDHGLVTRTTPELAPHVLDFHTSPTNARNALIDST
ncbi:hypothetical protein TNCV_170311 [Trichonephila clavipes]|nr:hypothetical protein TNCV_170311 [Trichonephila clavipes]